MMHRASSINDFVRRPVGRMSLGENHLLWCHSPTLCGSAHWGRYTAPSIADLAARLELSLHEDLAGGFDVFMDSRRVEGIDWAGWQALARYVRGRLPVWNRRIRRHAIVHPPGVVGALVGAMLPMLGPGYTFRFFPSVPQALAWLGRPELAAVLDGVEAAVAEARGQSPVLRAVRELLERSPATASLAAVARALGQSPRGLQRVLCGEGTHFSRELAEARLRAARTLLERSDETIEQIARRVGLGLASTLTALFNRHLGQTPSAYRAGRRVGAPAPWQDEPMVPAGPL